MTSDPEMIDSLWLISKSKIVFNDKQERETTRK
jgi:hypothetical protein